MRDWFMMNNVTATTRSPAAQTAAWACRRWLARIALAWAAVAVCLGARASANDEMVLPPGKFAHHIQRFNAMEDENVTNFVSNAQSWAWLQDNIPFFDCPDHEVEEIYYFRWWSFRKHLKQTKNGFVLTEFLAPVGHAGIHNTISCAVGHHLAEGRWLREPRYLDDYTRFWLRGNNGKPQPHFHKYSNWFAAAVYDRFLVNADRRLVTELLNDLVDDYRAWEQERRLPDGLFWQYDVRDGMEESISGSETRQQARPTINSYQFANARAIAAIARVADRRKVAAEFDQKAAGLKQLTQSALWDAPAGFFKVRLESGEPSDAREAIGFIPWMFSLPDAGKGCEAAWAQLAEPAGFRAPFGITTAERRHPQFRSRGVGTCEWDGAVWPFATSQTLVALANVLRDYPQSAVTTRNYFDAFLTYVCSQRANGKPYVGEYLDEVTGDWINGKNGRSRYYNHSTFADLLITGVVGLRPRADDVVEVHPLLPPGTWDWFCLDVLQYHGRRLTVIWDEHGSRYGRGAGLRVLVNGKEIAHTRELERLTGKLP